MEHEFIATTLKGAEKFLRKELNQYGIQCKNGEQYCEFSTTKKRLLEFAYFSQTAERICIKLYEAERDDKEKFRIPNEIARREFKPVIIGDDEKGSIRKLLEEKCNVKYSSKERILFIAEKERVIIAEDILNYELSKRDYRVFVTPRTLNPIVAASLALMSNPCKTQTILDPFCNDGTIAIETAFLLLHKSINYYTKNIFKVPFFDFDVERFLKELDKKEFKDELKILVSDLNSSSTTYTKKNAKIAGIHKKIEPFFNIKEVEERLQKKKIDMVLSFPKKSSKSIYVYNMIEKHLSENGFLCFALDDTFLLPKEFNCKEKIEIMQGKKMITLARFSLNNSL